MLYVKLVRIILGAQGGVQVPAREGAGHLHVYAAVRPGGGGEGGEEDDGFLHRLTLQSCPRGLPPRRC